MPEYSDEEDDYDEADMPHVMREVYYSGRHFSTVELGGSETLDRYLSCPVCLSLLNEPTATECLHRFCSDCINTSLRLGKKECPSCRFPISTRRALRRDHNFEALIRALYPNGQPESDDEVVDFKQFQFVPLRAPTVPKELAAAVAQKEERPAARAKKKTPPQQHQQQQEEVDEAMDEAAPAPAKKPRNRKAPAGAAQSSSSTYADGAAAPELPPPARPKKWACPQCTLINSAAAKKCTVCEAPNPDRAAAAGASKPRKQSDGAAAESAGGSTGGVVRSKKSVAAAMAAAEQAKQQKVSEWDREMMKVTKRQRSQAEINAAKQKREERAQARKGQHATKGARNAVRPEPELDFGDDAPSIEAQLLQRSKFSLHIKSADQDGVVLIW
jgi:hypothetical protein